MHIQRYLTDFLSLLYPALCIGCQRPLSRGVAHICVKCRYDLPKTHNHQLQINSLHEKFDNIVDYKNLFAYCYYRKGGLFQNIIHELKYGNRPEVGILLARWYASELRKSLNTAPFDLIIPVPLHQSKLRTRGYNQAEKIAQGIAEVFEKPVLSEGLVRVKGERSLTTLGKVNRMKLLQNTYSLHEKHITNLKGKHLLIVDDVLTTGSTLIACHQVLEEAKPSAISFLVLGMAE